MSSRTSLKSDLKHLLPKTIPVCTVIKNFYKVFFENKKILQNRKCLCKYLTSISKGDRLQKDFRLKDTLLPAGELRF